MKRFKYAIVIILLTGMSIYSQQGRLSLTFDDNNRSVTPKSVKVFVYTENRRKIRLAVVKNEILFPHTLKAGNKHLDLRIVWDGRNITFVSIPAAYFDGELLIGIDDWPFESDYQYLADPKLKTKTMYYAQFDSKTEGAMVRTAQ